MTHYYSDAQKAATRIVLNMSRVGAESVAVLGSVYMPLLVFIRVRRLEMDNTGGGGMITDYTAIDYDGRITRDASLNLPFENNNKRMLVFSELIPVNEP
jgi:hypothetical protein